MSIGLLAAAAALPVAAGVGPAASGAADVEASAQSEVVGCWNYLRKQVGFRKKPSQCVFMRNGRSSSADAVYVTDMKNWKRWGRPVTKVEGTFRGQGGFKTDIKVRLTRIRERCGERVYTKARFTVPAFDHQSGSLRLYSCKR